MVADANINTRIPAPDLPNGGKYYYEMEYDGRNIAIALKEGLIPEEFMALTRKAKAQTLSALEAERLQEIKETIAATLMSKDPEDIFNWIVF